MKTRAFTSLVAAGLCGLLSTTSLADDIVAVSWSGDVYTIDSTTGSGSLLNGSRTYTGLNASAKNSAGEIYSSSGTTLVKVDPVTGNVTPVATMSINSLRGMDFGPNDVLYAYNDEGFGSPDVLYTINVITGVATRIGLASNTGVQGLAIDSQGNAYAWDIGVGLLRANLSTGATTPVGSFGGTGDIQCLGFDANDDLWGSRDSLFQISLTDGSYVPVGSGGYTDVRGMEFIGGASGYRLRITGQCPGTITVSWDGANANSTQGVIFASNQGSFVIPNGPCQGTMLGLGSQNLRLVRTLGTGSGSGSVNSNVGTPACGAYLQFIQLPGCETTNVAAIP